MSPILLVLACLVLSTYGLELKSQADISATCHPECRWQCDDPTCPAVCHPVCERPKCQMQCEQPPAAECQVHCERPSCTVRCPKDMCEKEGCPQCETVCAPAKCHTECVAPEPSCNPLCEETKCDWKCRKPTSCQKPKCDLQCERPACESGTQPAPVCCPCDQTNARFAVTGASHTPTDESMLPSFLEVVHSFKLQASSGGQPCCPCGPRKY